MIAGAVTTALAGQPDPRFDGVWIGTETFHRGDKVAFNPNDPTAKRATIAIAESGKRLGIVDGPGRGQYEIAAETNGNLLTYQVPGWDKSMREKLRMLPGRHCKLTLSADGKTLTEDGIETTATHGSMPADFQNIKGVFHRQSR